MDLEKGGRRKRRQQNRGVVMQEYCNVNVVMYPINITHNVLMC
jgi:hypothetical protein